MISFAELFTRVLVILQCEEPLVYIMHSEISQLLLTIVNSFRKTECVLAHKITDGLLDDASKYLPLDNIECGTGVREAMSAASVSPVDVATFVVKARSAYIASAKHIIDKVQLTSSGLLKPLTCLQPGNRTKTSSRDYIAKLCDALP